MYLVDRLYFLHPLPYSRLFFPVLYTDLHYHVRREEDEHPLRDYPEDVRLKISCCFFCDNNLIIVQLVRLNHRYLFFQ